MSANNLIVRLTKDKITFFVGMIKEDLPIEEVKERIEQYLNTSLRNKTKTIDELMVKYDCSINNFEAPENLKKEVEENLQEYFLVKHITTLARSGYTPPTPTHQD